MNRLMEGDLVKLKKIKSLETISSDAVGEILKIELNRHKRRRGKRKHVLQITWSDGIRTWYHEPQDLKLVGRTFKNSIKATIRRNYGRNNENGRNSTKNIRNNDKGIKVRATKLHGNKER